MLHFIANSGKSLLKPTKRMCYTLPFHWLLEESARWWILSLSEMFSMSPMEWLLCCRFSNSFTSHSGGLGIFFRSSEKLPIETGEAVCNLGPANEVCALPNRESFVNVGSVSSFRMLSKHKNRTESSMGNGIIVHSLLTSFGNNSNKRSKVPDWG